MKYYFEIAGVKILIDSEINILWNTYIQKFLCSPFLHGDEYYKCLIGDLPNPEGTLIYHDDYQYIFRNGEREERIYFFWGQKIPCMLYREDSKYKIIYLNEVFRESFKREDNYCIFNALALEKVLLDHGMIVLHSSYIIWNGEAILFTAPSGTGKSTQAELWRKERNAEVVNGDRSIIKKMGDRFYAMGMPVCGSSDICLNKSAPIRAIVYLSQAREDVVKDIFGAEKVKKLISETTINSFNPEFVNKAIVLLSEAGMEIPMYNLYCTKEVTAVEALEKKLTGGNYESVRSS